MNILKKLFRRPPQGEQTRQQSIAQADGYRVHHLPIRRIYATHGQIGVYGT